MDIRRTFSVEMDLGSATKVERALMMANDLDSDSALDRTYAPVTLEKAKQTLNKRAAGQCLRAQFGEQDRDRIPTGGKAQR
ncbi:MAG: hypothetical protein AAFW81_10975 [Pseudomonadota bacterium]